MPFTSIGFHNEWDKIIRDWMKNPAAVSPFVQRGAGLSNDHLPEPYFGDMDKCSTVIINLNPGVGVPSQEWTNQNMPGTEVNEAKTKLYSGHAKPFLYLDNPYPLANQAGADWWQKRLKWINRILKAKGIQSNKKPFAIELCPLHSPNFSIKDPVKYVKICNPDVLDAIDYAVRHSDAQFGLAIGKSIFNVLTHNGYSEVNHITSTVPQSGGKQVKREYSLLESCDGIRIICTWAPGSNNVPSDKHVDAEEEILKSV